MELHIRYVPEQGWYSCWIVGHHIIRTSDVYETVLEAYEEAVIWAAQKGPDELCYAVVNTDPSRKEGP